MKLCATLRSSEAFSKLIATMERGGPLVLLFTPERLQLVCAGDALDSMKIFGRASTERLFSSYLVESQNANCIGLEVDCGFLLQALRSGKNASNLLLRLAKSAAEGFRFSS
eukprot:c404_g1_i1.p2 GENE.c404_g1_i1~~c404_g1_i1.p2  ORF type:complete len:121 (-),score=20.72 c404_g1_i1:502-834(-)